MRFCIVILFCFVGSAFLAAQSPWARSHAGFYTQLAWHTIPAYTSIFDVDGGGRTLDRELTERTLQFYGEYGLSDQTTLVASIPYRFVQSGAFQNSVPAPQTEQGALNGLGNASIALRQQLWNKGIHVASTVRFDLPTDNYDSPTGLRTGYDAFTIQPMISVGKGFGKMYAFAYGSYGWRSDRFSAFTQAGLEGGAKLGPVWLILFTDLILPFENGSVNVPYRNFLTALYVDNQGWWSYGVKGLWEINRFWGVVVSGAGAGWAQNVPRNPGLMAGVFFKWD
jgi:hypothetical protein